MKTRVTLLLALAALSTACSFGNNVQPVKDREELWRLDAVRGASLHRALVIQSAVFPYHFTPGTAQLNELGRRDLSVLATHFRDHAGRLSVRRGGASSSMYEARVMAVVKSLVAAGVSEDFVEVTDGFAGGDGMDGESVVKILGNDDDEGGLDSMMAIPLVLQ